MGVYQTFASLWDTLEAGAVQFTMDDLFTETDCNYTARMRWYDRWRHSGFDAVCKSSRQTTCRSSLLHQMFMIFT